MKFTKRESLEYIRRAWCAAQALEHLGMNGLVVKMACYVAWERMGTSYEEECVSWLTSTTE